MKSKAPAIARILLGSVFLIFGLNGFLRFIPMSQPPPGAAAFFGGLMAASYMLPLIKGVEVIGGALLLANRFVPLALALLAANVVNIVLFHAFLEPAGLPLAFLVLVPELFLAWSYRDAYRPMLAAHVEPAKAARSTRAAATDSSMHAPV
jgi:uncharacterized membrane protein YphA (DoxX/SURF4 family)